MPLCSRLDRGGALAYVWLRFWVACGVWWCVGCGMRLPVACLGLGVAGLDAFASCVHLSCCCKLCNCFKQSVTGMTLRLRCIQRNQPAVMTGPANSKTALQTQPNPRHNTTPQPTCNPQHPDIRSNQMRSDHMNHTLKLSFALRTAPNTSQSAAPAAAPTAVRISGS